MAKRDRIDDQIRQLGVSLNGHGHGTTGRTRPQNGCTLIEALCKTLKGKQMTVMAAAQAVRREGYITHSPENFRTMVNQALLSREKFKRVSRGVYTAK